ncbi:putative phosphoribosyltransferase [Actinoplanes octamycinicus]|uniref:Putative phosphoribosyltransferase n=1 Tax=Actinoplanes octamycinicus TaxID=135948 RepID=A0A7W7H663_9ACTN|nr:phosphoribosyltransferase family protein [Actinoplanes octamycinicus]MBB4744745.1 putative phosphoribosyltransferase [Actinoplanes octamycinicus]GIE55327.1 phosphoribosyltransferase [Actinoplanes octamycinicus]
MIFADRAEAGRALADRVAEVIGAPGDRPLVLALPRGGLPVAAPVAERLGADLDIVVARKLGAPGHPEFGLGAIAEDGPPVYDQGNLRYAGVTEQDLAGTLAAERAELARRVRRYRGSRPAPPVTGRVVVLVDDGLATGVTAHAALRWINGRDPDRVLLAVPVCAPPARDLLAPETDRVVCLSAPPEFFAVGRWYRDFGQLTDEDVDAVLQRFHHALK